MSEENKAKKENKQKKEDIEEIVRVLSTDLKGKLMIKNSLRNIKGVSFTTSKIIYKKARVDPDKITGKLTKDERASIEKVVKNPEKFNIPDYILNLRKNPKTGKDEHLTGANLQIETRKRIGDMKKLGSYIGIRHRNGLPVRGQRTKSSFRKSKTVGVSKRKLAKK